MARARCSFCDKPQSAADPLVSSPADYDRVYICDACIRVCMRAIGDAPGHVGGDAANPAQCSFCHLSADRVRLQASPGDPPKAMICEQCLMVCMSILDVTPPEA